MSTQQQEMQRHTAPILLLCMKNKKYREARVLEQFLERSANATWNKQIWDFDNHSSTQQWITVRVNPAIRRMPILYRNVNETEDFQDTWDSAN